MSFPMKKLQNMWSYINLWLGRLIRAQLQNCHSDVIFTEIGTKPRQGDCLQERFWKSLQSGIYSEENWEYLHCSTEIILTGMDFLYNVKKFKVLQGHLCACYFRRSRSFVQKKSSLSTANTPYNQAPVLACRAEILTRSQSRRVNIRSRWWLMSKITLRNTLVC